MDSNRTHSLIFTRSHCSCCRSRRCRQDILPTGYPAAGYDSNPDPDARHRCIYPTHPVSGFLSCQRATRRSLSRLTENACYRSVGALSSRQTASWGQSAFGTHFHPSSSYDLSRGPSKNHSHCRLYCPRRHCSSRCLLCPRRTSLNLHRHSLHTPAPWTLQKNPACACSNEQHFKCGQRRWSWKQPRLLLARSF